jgi:hypothetical protein
MLKQLGVAVALAAAGLAQAQTPLPANATKKELVARVLQLQQPGIELMARQMTEQPAVRFMQQAAGALQRVAEDRREAMARDIEADVRKYVEETTPIVRDRAVKLAPTTIGPILEEKLTEDELRQIIAVLESPVQRKFQSLAPDMQRALGEKLVAESRADVEAKLRALDQVVSKRLGLTPAPGASAPATAATPAAPKAPAKK